MEQNKTAKDAKAAFVSIGSYPVGLTYSFTNPPTSILFTCKMIMTADDVAARQAFYAKPTGDQEAGEFEYLVDMLCRITEKVDGLPGFEMIVTAADGEKLLPFSEQLKAYFSSGQPILRKIAKDAVEMYNRISQPEEFFR